MARKAGRSRVAALGEDRRERRAAPFEAAAQVGQAEAHVARVRRHPQVGQQPGEEGIGPLVVDEEPGVGGNRSLRGDRPSPCCACPPGRSSASKRWTSWRSCSRCAAVMPAMPLPMMAMRKACSFSESEFSTKLAGVGLPAGQGGVHGDVQHGDRLQRGSRTRCSSTWPPSPTPASGIPGVTEGESLTPGPRRVGSVYRLAVRIAGRVVPFDYRVLDIDRPRRVVLQADARAMVSTDTITVERAGPAPGSATWRCSTGRACCGSRRLSSPGCSPAWRTGAPPGCAARWRDPCRSSPVGGRGARGKRRRQLQPGRLRRAQSGWSTGARPRDLTGRVVVVTGASSGIGQAAALELARLGATVWLVGRDKRRTEAAARTARALGAGAAVEPVELDIVDADAVRRVRGARRHPARAACTGWSTPRGALPDVSQRARRWRADGGHRGGGAVPPDVAAQPAPAPSRRRQHRDAVVWRHVHPAVRPRPAGNAPERVPRDHGLPRAKRAQVVLSHEWARRWGADGVASYAAHPGWVDTPGLASGLPDLRQARAAAADTGTREPTPWSGWPPEGPGALSVGQPTAGGVLPRSASA